MLKNESKISDEFFGDSVILKGALKVDAKLSDVNLSRLQSIKIIYQGCAEGKYCYPKRFKSL
jgi:thiol:disulfide interchange protein